MTAELSVVIVSYESSSVLPGALASLPSGLEVIVVDNNSRDQSVAIAEGAGAQVLRNTQNLGFGTACNQGASVATGRFILFLNPDARVTAQGLQTLIDGFADQPDIAATGPLLETAGEVALPRQATLIEPDRAPSFSERPETPIDVGFLSGAALMVRREAFHEIGGFDEEIFLYLEDDDLCYRLRQAGHRLRLIPSAIIRHEKEPNTKASGQSLRFSNRHTLRSTRYLAEKHGAKIDLSKAKRKARTRLIRAILTFDRVRVHVNIGRLQGLGAWPFH